MRTTRLITAVLAFCLIGLVPFVGGASASASELQTSSVAGSPAAGVDSSERAKGSRKVILKSRQATRRSLRFIGRVQAATKKKITLVRANGVKGPYRQFRAARTDARGRFVFNDIRKTGYYAVKVPSDKKYKTSYSNVIRVYYR